MFSVHALLLVELDTPMDTPKCGVLVWCTSMTVSITHHMLVSSLLSKTVVESLST